MVDYTLTELMAVAAAREIRDGEVVFAGTGLPMLGAMRLTHTCPRMLYHL
jgi:glutaconate CoA-transferase subunit B